MWVGIYHYNNKNKCQNVIKFIRIRHVVRILLQDTRAAQRRTLVGVLREVLELVDFSFSFRSFPIKTLRGIHSHPKRILQRFYYPLDLCTRTDHRLPSQQSRLGQFLSVKFLNENLYRHLRGT